MIAIKRAVNVLEINLTNVQSAILGIFYSFKPVLALIVLKIQRFNYIQLYNNAFNVKMLLTVMV